MTNRDSAALQRYYRNIWSWLPCSQQQKSVILKSITCNIENFVLSNPSADFAEIENHFGSPQQIASSYVEDMNTPELLHALRTRKRIVVVVMAVVLSALLIWACAVTVAVIDFSKSNNGYFITDLK